MHPLESASPSHSRSSSFSSSSGLSWRRGSLSASSRQRSLQDLLSGQATAERFSPPALQPVTYHSRIGIVSRVLKRQGSTTTQLAKEINAKITQLNQTADVEAYGKAMNELIALRKRIKNDRAGQQDKADFLNQVRARITTANEFLWTILGGIALRMGVSKDALLAQLEGPVPDPNAEGTITQDQMGDYDPSSSGQLKAMVPPSLLRGLDGMTDSQKVDKVFENLRKHPFSYTGGQKMATAGFLSHSGDCYTLSSMFVLATQAAGVQGVSIRSSPKGAMLVDRRAVNGRQKQTNVLGEPYWFFDEHHWCEYNGQSYDSLFMSKGIIPNHGFAGNDTYAGVPYLKFKNGACIIMQNELSKLGVSITDGTMQGYVADSPQEIEAYIARAKIKQQ